MKWLGLGLGRDRIGQGFKGPEIWDKDPCSGAGTIRTAAQPTAQEAFQIRRGETFVTALLSNLIGETPLPYSQAWSCHQIKVDLPFG